MNRFMHRTLGLPLALAALSAGATPVEPLTPLPHAKQPDVSENPIFSPIVPSGNRLFNSSFELGLPGWCLVCNTRYDAAAEGGLPVVTTDADAKHGTRSLKIDMRPRKLTATLNSHDCYGVIGSNFTFSCWIRAEKAVRLRMSLGDCTSDRTGKCSDSWYSEGGSVAVGTDWTRVSFTTRRPLNAVNCKAVVKIDLPPGNVYWFDAAKVEVGDRATDYAPMAPAESANVVKDPVVVRGASAASGDYEFRAIDYRTGERIVEKRSFDALKYGVQSLGGRWRGAWTLPEYVAIVHPLGKTPFQISRDDPGFFLGVNGGTGRGSISGGYVWMIGAGGVETSTDIVRRLRLAGNAMLRVHGVNQWVDFEYEKGKFKWDTLDRVILPAAEAGLEPLFVLGNSAFMAWVDPRQDGKRRDWYVRKNSREAKKHGFYNAKKNTGAKSRIPSDDDWVEHLTGLYNHYKGVITWYEPINEPNLQLADAGEYTDILKLSYRTLKALDPKLKVVGICATGDFGGNIGRYVDDIGKAGGFDYLDYMSFHPYDAAVDYLKPSAEEQLETVTRLCEKFRPGVPRLQDEAFYLCDNVKIKGGLRGLDWPAGNIARRAALDLAYGCIGSVSLDSCQYSEGDACHPRHTNSRVFNFRFSPSGVFAAQNFCAVMLEGARNGRKAALPAGLNGATATRPDGRRVTVLWFREPGGQLAYPRPANATVYDLYGNEIADRTLTVTDDPIYIVEKKGAARSDLDPEWAERLVEVVSTYDKTPQPCYFWKSEKADREEVPLMVGVHTWSGDYRQIVAYRGAFNWARTNGWAFVGPNFRGSNDHPLGCGSDAAVQDIVDAIEYAKAHARIDVRRIYISGGSGGGHISLLTASRHPDLFAGVAAFCPITDLARWHADSRLAHPGRNKAYADMLERACGGTPEMRLEEYAHRSPLTYLRALRMCSVPVYLGTGIHDGWRGSVPVGHVIRAYNLLANETDRLSEETIAAIEATQKVPAELAFAGNDPLYGEKMRIHLRKTSANVRLTIFEGGHDGNYRAGFDFLSRQRKGAPADFSLPQAETVSVEKTALTK